MIGGRTNKTVKNTVYNTIGTFAYFFFQWVTTVVVVRLAGYGDAGVFALVVSFTNVFGFISRYGMRNYQISDYNNVFSSHQYFGARIWTTGIAIAGFFFISMFCGFDLYTYICALAYMAFKFLESLTDYLFAIFQKLDKYKEMAISYIIKGVLPLLGFIGFLWFFKSLFAAICCMTLLYALIILCYDFSCIQAKKTLRVSFKGSKKILSACLPLMLATLITPYMTFIIRFFIEKLYGDKMLGYYSSVSMVVVVMTTLAGSVWYVIIPIISKYYTEMNFFALKRLLTGIFFAIAAAGAVVILLGQWLGPWAFGLVFGKGILDYMYLLTPVLLASVLLTATAFFSTVLIPLQRRSAMLWCNVVGAVACTIAVYPMTKAHGMVGANNSLLLGLAVQLLLLGGVTFFTLRKKEAYKNG